MVRQRHPGAPHPGVPLAGAGLRLHGRDHRHLPCSPQTDVVRYRALLLVLAAGKTASSLGSLAFFLIQEHVFIYLLNFLVDGFLALFALWLWVLAGRVGRPADPG